MEFTEIEDFDKLVEKWRRAGRKTVLAEIRSPLGNLVLVRREEE
jgi:hypothetical protein